MDDNRIIDLYFTRDERAIEQTRVKYGKLLYHVAYKILHSDPDSEECVDDTYMKAWGSMPPEKPSILSAFLCKITRNLSINRYLQNKSRSKIMTTEKVFEEIAECVPDTAGPISDDIALRDAINGFLESLGEVSRSIFIDNTGAWFLPCLFLLMLTFAVLSLLRSRWTCLHLWVALLFAQFFATGTYMLTGNPFLRSMSSYMFPFSIGIYLAYKPRIMELCQKRVSLIMLLAVFAVSSVGFAHFVVLDGGSAALMGKVCRMVAGVSAIPLVFVLFSFIKTNAMTRVLSVVGKSTLAIYLFQDTPVSYAKIFKVGNAGIGMVCLALCISVVVIFQGVAIKRLFERSKVLSFLFLGRRWSG